MRLYAMLLLTAPLLLAACGSTYGTAAPPVSGPYSGASGGGGTSGGYGR